METRYSTMTVGRIESQEDRTILYSSPAPTYDKWGEYHIIAPRDCSVKVGDTVKYEPFGFNFGWLARKD
jgi:hypothetical protein